ncbi:MAG: hypothetical protein LBB11_00350 [Puniceicoccales bacterium]|jgi:hypothetical protein|nr:hypothetical protein [Puniceicoccales bacterium]
MAITLKNSAILTLASALAGGCDATSPNMHTPTVSSTALTENFSNKIFTANRDEEALMLLKKAYEAYKHAEDPRKELFLFVDIDDTLIESGSDMESYYKYGNFNGIHAINLSLIRQLHTFQNTAETKIIGLTNVNHWRLEIGNRCELTPYCAGVATAKVMPSTAFFRVRIDAMKKIGIPLNTSFWPEEKIKHLPFLLQDSSTEGVTPFYEKSQPFEITSKGNVEITTPNDFSLPWERRYLSIKEGNKEVTNEIFAYPVYSEGIIFVNPMAYFPLKGAVIRAFLASIFNGETHWPPLFLIAIDDDKAMLESIQQQCNILRLKFWGIHIQCR